MIFIGLFVYVLVAVVVSIGWFYLMDEDEDDPWPRDTIEKFGDAIVGLFLGITWPLYVVFVIVLSPIAIVVTIVKLWPIITGKAK